MRNITYKYNVGNYIRFKSKFTNPTCGLVWRAGTVAKITGIAKAYNNKPHYYVNGVEDEVFPESVFAGLATESEFLTQSPEYIEVDTSVGPETKCDTGDSGESENLWDVIAELSDIRAGYNLFSDKEQAKYHALTVAINKLREDARK